MTFIGTFPDRSPRRDAVSRTFRADETTVVTALLAHADLGAATRARVSESARRLVEEMRRRLRTSGGLDAFLHEYGLSTQEGVVLMCLAEALLRIPDAKTANRLIHEKLGEADWN